MAADVPPVPEIEYEEVLRATKNGQCLLLDVRNSDEFAKGKIPSARLLPVSELEQALQLDNSQFEQKYGFTKPGTDQTILTYCGIGGRASRACGILLQHGYTGAVAYKGSWKEWSAKHPEDCC